MTAAFELGRRLLVGAVMLAAGLAPGFAQTSPPATTTPPAQQTPAPTAPDATPDPAKPTTDAVTTQVIEAKARPVAVLSGSSNWDDGFKTVSDQFSRIAAELAKNNVKVNGRPLAVFVETDDNGFKYQAMIPVEKPEGKDALGDGVTFGLSPAGKAMKFQHRGAYEDIDSTYEAITAYLDEKGLEAKSIFAEEYLTDPKTSDETGLEIDIYVFLK